MISTVIEALCVGIMCAVCYKIGWNKGTGEAIHKAISMDNEIEGLEAPDSVTVSATSADGKIIEITIAIKDGDTE